MIELIFIPSLKKENLYPFSYPILDKKGGVTLPIYPAGIYQLYNLRLVFLR